MKEKLRSVLNVGKKWRKAIYVMPPIGEEEQAFCVWDLAKESLGTDAETVVMLNSIQGNEILTDPCQLFLFALLIMHSRAFAALDILL